MHMLVYSNALDYSPYDVLDVDETATPEEIKKKYRQTSLCA
jgi:DnaJ family protein C protein 8